MSTAPDVTHETDQSDQFRGFRPPIRDLDELKQFTKAKHVRENLNLDFLAVLPYRHDIGHWTDHLELVNPSPEPKPTLVTLPAEIIHHIVGYVDFESLKHFRLSCLRLARDSRPSLFRHVMVTETPESFQRLLKICRYDIEIANSIRSLTYIPFTLKDEITDRKDWDDITGHMADDLTRAGQSYKFLASFEEYKGLLEDRAALASTKANITTLARALLHIKPRTINIFDIHYQRCNPKDPPGHALFRDIFQRMPLCFDGYSRSGFLGNALYAPSRAVATRSFMAVLMALDQSGYALPELKAKTGLMMLMSPSIEVFGRVVQKLRKLDLTVDFYKTETISQRLSLTHVWDAEDPQEMPTDIHFSRFLPGRTPPGTWTLGEFLSHATSLRELALRIQRPYCPSYSNKQPRNMVRELSLIEFVLPHLISLTLHRITSSDNDLLLPIIAHAKTLRRLEIHSPRMRQSLGTSATWPNFFKLFRKHIRDSTVYLDRLVLTGTFRFGVNLSAESTRLKWKYAPEGSEGQTVGECVAEFVLGIRSKCLWPSKMWRVHGNIDLEVLMSDDPEEPADEDEAQDVSKAEEDDTGENDG